MGEVELRFPASAGHVRTARLVAVAVARRAHLDDVRVDELRLAVGEACARAVRCCAASPDGGRVLLVIDDSGPGLIVEVSHAVQAQPDAEPPAKQERDEGDDPLVLSLLRGLADAMEVLDGVGGPGCRVRMEWWPPLSTTSPPLAPRRPAED